MKVNTGDSAMPYTIREAAILEDLQGRGGAPHLISVIPELGMMVMWTQHTLKNYQEAPYQL